MKASDYIATVLREQGVSCVFEMSGGMITHMLDSIHRIGGVRIVSMHHEQGAAFAVDGLARMTGIPAVAMATSGPGATNLLTGIGSCHFDSVPAVFITGQVNRHEQKGDRAIRQLGFQETDIVAMARPITKAAWQVNEPAQLPAMLAQAFALAREGRPGPVLLDIPMDVQNSQIEPPDSGTMQTSVVAEAQEERIEPQALADLFANLSAAQRPLILVGGGIRSSHTTQLLREFVHRVRAPVINSLMGVDVLPCADPLRVGMIGSYGNRWANLAIGRSDFMLVLGSRLDVRQTGAQTAAFKGDRTIYHVDVEAGEINNRVIGCHAILSHLHSFLRAANLAAAQRSFADWPAWMAEINALRCQWPDTGELAGTPGINPNAFMHALSAVSHSAQAYVIDVGQHQMWAAQSLQLGADQRFLTSGGMGSMGFALPAAIGAAFADPKRAVVVIAGDGGFQSNIQELQTVVRNGLPLKIVVINNGCHGMVRQFQQSYFDSRYQSTLWGYSAPDFVRVATAYGIAGRTIDQVADIEGGVRWLWDDPASPALLQVMVDTEANAYPKLAFGHTMAEMEPFVKPIAMEST